MSSTKSITVYDDVASLLTQHFYIEPEFISEARKGNTRLLRRLRRLKRRCGPHHAESVERIRLAVLGWNRLLDSQVVRNYRTGEVFLVAPEEYFAIQAEREEALPIPEIRAREQVLGPLWD